MKMNDNDEIFKPNASGFEVYSTNGREDLPTVDDLVKEFPKVFIKTVGKLDGCYRIIAGQYSKTFTTCTEKSSCSSL